MVLYTESNLETSMVLLENAVLNGHIILYVQSHGKNRKNELLCTFVIDVYYIMSQA